MNKPRDYNRWFKRCVCGYDPAHVGLEGSSTCWKCGKLLHRDFTDRALKVNSKLRSVCDD